MPHYKELLEFINLCAQASASDHSKKSLKGDAHPPRKSFARSKPVTSFATNTTDPVGNCVLWTNIPYTLFKV